MIGFQKTLVKYLINIMVFMALVAMLYGCYATRPNITIIDEKYIPSRGSQIDENFFAVKFLLTEISSNKELLAIELGKLPELQDGVSVKERQALEVIINFYNNYPAIFDKAFGEMYNIGIPAVRQYCTPLQALFWLAEDGELNNEDNPLVNFSLNNLLDKAWKLSRRFSYVMSGNEIEDVIDGILPEDERQRYLKYRQQNTNDEMQSFFIMEHSGNIKMFSPKAERVIKQVISRKNPRWEDFDTVVKRLNAPELIDYYERKRFQYVDWRSLPAPSVSPWHVFKYNKGECVSITGFTSYCLEKGGYKAREIRVRDLSGLYDFHAVCLFERNGEKYVMDNGRPVGCGIIPYDEFIKIYF